MGRLRYTFTTETDEFRRIAQAREDGERDARSRECAAERCGELRGEQRANEKWESVVAEKDASHAAALADKDAALAAALAERDAKDAFIARLLAERKDNN